MKARDLAAEFPAVHLDTPAIEAARLLAGQDLPGLIVLDARGYPSTILAGTQVLRMAIPQYCQDDPALARVVDEPAADLLLRELGDRTVAQALPAEKRELAVVAPDATVLEIAAVMARTRTPLVAVVDKQRQLLGAITLDALLDRMLE
ncbi:MULTISPECIES: CBS domain-containing protein [Dactylosporangium]|uniref:Histidine kinase n=2 Tax=Dactylosporangium TaxID=35753 RepID=A0A9W6KQY4_9ACTN|nr:MULTISPECIES: CBS domain-containing protein [Dactylosporangium]UAB92851.1 CBS domain-containing protein [Dactylosporangium vinaceum]UWZ41269.1 CBS domain-containing protein [Dactylosporangium matsuzakiense]GLL05643.1 histidine kinase [Dactylosporangium matsuzakiense]